MPRIRSGISSIGGKFRLLNKILNYVPYHEFYLEPFLGAGWILLNKYRCRYECGNDANSEIINYLLIIERYPDQFDEMKQGVFGLVSQEICNQIIRGEIQPRNNLERAYFFYYLNKLTFGGDIKKVQKNDCEDEAHYCGIMRPTDPIRKPQYEQIKKEYETKGFGGIINPRAIPQNTLHEKDFEKIKKEWKTKGFAGLVDQKRQNARIDKEGIKEAKETYRGIVLPTVCKEKSINGAKTDFKNVCYSLQPPGMQVRKTNVKQAKSSFAGINNTRAGSNASNMRDMDKSINEAKINYRGVLPIDGFASKRDLPTIKSKFRGTSSKVKIEEEKVKNHYQAIGYKGINPKTTRPFKNNDCGLLTPIDREAIKRLRYVNLTSYDFRKVYKLFYEAFHVRKGLNRECFVYFDPPFPGTEKYYGDRFKEEDHQDLIDILLKSPFNCMLSIGSKCKMYLEALKDWVIIPVKVKYSTDAISQSDSQEYIIMNYEISKLSRMGMDYQKPLTKFMKEKQRKKRNGRKRTN